MTIKIAFASSDGGVGQTTQIYNLAYYLESKKNKVLLIDLTTQSSLSKLCGKKNSIETSKNIFLGGDVEIQGASEMIDIIPSNKTIIDVAPVLRANGVQNVYFILDDWLRDNEEDLKNYDFILIDGEKTADTVTKNAIATADFVCGFIIPDQFSIDAIDEIKDTLNELRNETFDKRHDEYTIDTKIILVGNMLKTTRNASKSLLEVMKDEQLFVSWIVCAEKLFETSISGSEPLPIVKQNGNRKHKERIFSAYDKIIEKVKEG